MSLNNKRLLILRQFIHIMRVRPIHVILPVTLSFIAAFFDGIGLSLFIPLAKGIVTDFSFVKEIPILKDVVIIFINSRPGFLTPNKKIFIFLIVIIFLALILKNILSYISSALSVYWHGRFKRNVYKFIFDRLLSFGKLFFDRTNQGYLNTVINYSENVMEVLTIFETSVKQLFTLIVYFTVMIIISWKLTIITVAVFPILHYSLKLIITKIEKNASGRNRFVIERGSSMFNILSCIPLVKAYSKEDEIKKEYAKLSERVRLEEFRILAIYRMIEPIQDIIITAALLIMVSVVALLLAKDKPAEISVFVVFFYAARKSLPLFNVFNEAGASFAKFKPSLGEMTKIFDDKDKFFIKEGKVIFKGMGKNIDFVHLNFSYINDVQVLEDISFSIEKGKTTAIVGPTGSGKTTLISLLMRFYDCPQESVFIDGIDIRDYTLKSLRAHMALVSQEILLFNDSIRNNITFGVDKGIQEEELIDIAKKTRIYDFIRSLPDKFDTEIGDRGIKLSGGERQRIAIARALLKGSEIFILDEATSSLDSKTEKFIQDAINEAIRDRTAIVIAHRLSTIKNADKIVVIEKGMLVEEGSLNELLEKKGKFYEYWQEQKFY